MSNENESNNSKGNYMLPSYQKLLAFPNFKSKLAKKLSIKLEILVNKKALENVKPENKKCKEYINFLEAEINLIQHLLNTKEINEG
jgi:hypothetical protein